MLGLFFAFILRAISSNARRYYDSDDDYMAPRSAPRRPVADRQANQPPLAAGSGAATETRPRSDAWSIRMREKVCFVLVLLEFADLNVEFMLTILGHVLEVKFLLCSSLMVLRHLCSAVWPGHDRVHI